MVSFSSLEFIFRFLPIFLIVYFATPVKYKDIALLAGSLIFYAFGEPVFIFVLIFTTLVNYLLGRQAWKLGEGFLVQDWQNKKRKRLVIGTIIFDVLVLAVFKGLATFADSALLPLGISFYIFKMISFQADVLRGEIWSMPKLRSTALYFTMFP